MSDTQKRTIWAAWESVTDNTVAVSKDLRKIKDHINPLYDWDTKWALDEDGVWLRHYGGRGNEEYILLEQVPYLDG